MQSFPSPSPRLRRGFTLVELLVVISIIGVLAGLLLPALGRAKTVAKINICKTEITTLVAAIKQYETTYNSWPASKEAYDSATPINNPDCPDFTFGTTDKNGNSLSNSQGVVYSAIPGMQNIWTYRLDINHSYKNNNSEVIGILMDLEQFADKTDTANTNHVLNPQRHVFLEVKQSSSTTLPGIGPNGVYRDPWGNPYIITLNLSFNGRAIDGLYGTVRKNDVPKQSAEISREILVWSMGPDGQATAVKDANGKLGSKIGVNKDNICSWEL